MENNQEQLQTANAPLSASGGFAFSAFTVLYIFVMLIVSGIIKAANIGVGTDAYIYLNYLVSPVAIAACIALTLKVRKVGVKTVFPIKCKPKYYLIALLLVFGLLFSLNWLNEVAVKFFELFGYEQREASSYLPSLQGGLIVPALLVIAVLPAIFEEALFRGVIVNTCEESMGSIRTIFVVGFCFALFHASPEQTLYQFVGGCVFAFLAIRSHSVLPSVLMHFINNALIVVLSACGQIDASGNLAVSQGASIALTVCAACCLVGGLVWLVLDKTPVKKCCRGGVIGFFKYAWLAIVILAVLWFSAFFVVA